MTIRIKMKLYEKVKNKKNLWAVHKGCQGQALQIDMPHSIKGDIMENSIKGRRIGNILR